MRLLSITHYSALLGANRSLLHLLCGLRDQYGVVICVFCPRPGPFTEALEKEGIPYTIIPFANWAYTIRSLGLWLFPWKWRRAQTVAYPALLEAARDFAPDVIHSNSTVLSVGWQLSETLGKPHIWHLREFGWPDYQLVFPFGRQKMYEKLNRADAVVCISNAMAQAHAKALTKKPYVIYNGIGRLEKLKTFFAEGAARAGEQKKTYTFLIIGLLQPSKGQHDAFRAFAKLRRVHPGARLVVAGSGQKLYTLRLKMTARFLGLSKTVKFTGYVHNPAALYAEADAVLMCSRHEAMGRVTAEAMAYGKPVIGYNGGATPELIEDGVQGFLYHSILSLFEKMKQLLENEKLGIEMGKRGAQVAQTRFSDESYVAQFYSVLKKIAGS